ncbi:MAG TPA: diffusible signal factor-reguated Ax21 family protein [Arenimonas sp.]|nr:diffusible signal factor-reguated Ax21 family protein [Arenimonas sp.]
MKRSLIALSLAALLPLAAQADDKLSYTYVEADYVNIDNDADGFGLRGSFEFGDSGFYGFGAYNWIETDVGSVDIDASELGFGYAHGLGENLDLIGEAAWQNVDVDGFGDADGYRASVGLRGSISPKFEGLIKANYIDGDDVDGDFTGTIGAQYKFTRTWGITGEIEFGDDAETYLIGVRASF